jgi:hypothetical protein
MNIRRILLDVDKAIARPSLIDLAQAIDTVAGVAAFNITVTEIDVETLGMDITVEGEALEYEALRAAIESTGAVVHSIDEVVVGTHMVEPVRRRR